MKTLASSLPWPLANTHLFKQHCLHTFEQECLHNLEYTGRPLNMNIFTSAPPKDMLQLSAATQLLWSSAVATSPSKNTSGLFYYASGLLVRGRTKNEQQPGLYWHTNWNWFALFFFDVMFTHDITNFFHSLHSFIFILRGYKFVFVLIRKLAWCITIISVLYSHACWHMQTIWVIDINSK